jgi:acetylornithine/N-succinyldiaminopimelate aminotransferase
MINSAKKNLDERWIGAMEQNYGVPAISLVKGKGLYVWDESGKKYLDFLGGIAANILGHADPAVVKAVSSQIRTLGHISNFYSHPQGIALAEKLQELVGHQSKVFFCNSGAEANEAALKISRLTGRNRIISTEGSFHGRTMGALSLTGQPAKRAPFIPLLRGVKFLPYGDIRSMERSISARIAMVILEPIQGENGVVPPPPGYLRAVRDLCTKHGVLLCIDAVQTGMGRTGSWFGYESEGIVPDIITMAKGLGGGLPLGAMITVGNDVPHFSPGQHGSTFGGNPVSASAGLASIRVIEKKQLMKSTLLMEKSIRRALMKMEGILEVRGRGLLLGIVLKENIANELVALCLHNGLLVNATSANVIRIAPALTVSQVHIQEFAKKFALSLKEVSSHE